MKDYKRFCGMMNTLGEVFDKQMSKLLLEVYWKALAPFSDQEAEAAFSKAMVTCTFFPKPVELIEFISGSLSDRSLLAWEKFTKALAEVGVYQSVQFDDPVIHSVVELMGGWIQAGQWPKDELKWRQKEFERAYTTLQQRKDHPYPKELPGLLALENAAKGFLDHVPKPIEIGAHLEPQQIENKPKRLRMINPA